MTTLYRPGPTAALAGRHTLLLLGRPVDDPLVGVLWPAVAQDAPLETVLGVLMAGGLAGVPEFGLARQTGGDVVVVVRGSFTAVVTADGAPQPVSGAGVTTWTERRFAGATGVAVTAAGASPTEVLLPLLGGVVGGVHLETGDRAALPDRRCSGEPGAGDAKRSAEGALIPAAGGIPVAAETRSVGGLLDGTPWSSNRPAPAPVAGDHDGHTLRREDLPAAAPAAPRGPLLAVHCGQGHPSPPGSPACRVCGAELPATAGVAAAGRLVLGELRFSTGQRVTLDSGLLIGREPLFAGDSGGDILKPVQVPGPDVSRSHVEVRLDGWQVLLVDLGSTNGTFIRAAGLEPVQAPPRQPVPLSPGTVVDLAHEVSFTYEATA